MISKHDSCRLKLSPFQSSIAFSNYHCLCCVQLAGMVLQHLQHAGKVRLYELLLQHYGDEDLYTGDEAAPSMATLRQKTAAKEVKRVSS
jgi:hypothetical protein